MRDRWLDHAWKYGPAGVIAICLVWWLASDVSGDVHLIKATLAEHVIETNFYLRQVCLNVARDDAARSSCILPRDPR